MNTISDPVGFIESKYHITLKHSYRDEWIGACPLGCGCQGKDRFHVWVNKGNYWCRSCGAKGFVDELEDRKPILSPADIARQRQEYAERIANELEQQIKKAQRVLEELRQSQSWVRYHEQLDQEARQRWESWGVPDFYQEFYKLGYDPDHVVWCESSTEWHTPTMTIPIFEAQTWNVLNVKHRLLNPPKPGDKYRPERSGLPQSLFIADPDTPMCGKTLLVEGEKKAIVSFITADDPMLQVVGIPGKTPNKELLSKLCECEPIYVCLDPDARGEADKIAIELGSNKCRIIELPMKIDDMILKFGLGKSWMKKAMRQAVKV